MINPDSNLNIITIVPQLPPKVNGLGDQAWFLAKELENKYNCKTIFLNADPDRERIIQKGHFKEEKIRYNTSKPFLHVLKDYNPPYIILHYVGYGYSPTGCPDWLIDGLKKIKALNPNCKIITIFYELYASGKPWQRAFWTHLHQKRLTYKLLELSEHSVANTDITYNILKSKASHKNIHLVPVYSNLGEPENIPLFSQRKKSLVIFGSAAVREKIFQNDPDSLLYWIEKLKIENIIEIGTPRKNASNRVGNTTIIYEGILSQTEASKKLLENQFSMIYYPIHLLGKSSIFSSYASHGIVPIVVGDKNKKNTETVNGLKDGVNYINDPSLSTDYESISKNLYKWYQDHNLETTASRIYKMLKGN